MAEKEPPITYLLVVTNITILRGNEVESLYKIIQH